MGPNYRTALRSHRCGDLRPHHAGEQVSLTGWVSRRREHGEHLAFLDLRDHSGIVQCVVAEQLDARNEYVVRVVGTVRPRPEGTVNDKLPTGEIEVGDCQVEVLRTAEPPPFPIDARADDVDEGTRLEYRYLDLRRARMQRNLRTRSTVNSAVRRSMESQGFVEVETPMLMPSTPEGAREFLVPSRKERGAFYALPQSPQLFKQLLMVAGIDRYYQMARCLRDEDLRADRQYEFMQLDMEMSFVDADDVIAAVSDAVLAAAADVIGAPPGGIGRLTWRQAMDRFGSDKPDLRFGMELADLGAVFTATGFKAFSGAEAIKGLRVQGAADRFGRNQLDKLTDRAKSLGAKGLVWLKVGAGGDGIVLESPVAKFLSEAEQRRLVAAMGATPGDLLLIVADSWHTACEVTGQLRNELGRPPVHEGPYRFRLDRRLPAVRGPRRHQRPAASRPPRLLHAPPRRPGAPRIGSDVGQGARLRPGAQRLGARLRIDPDPRRRPATPGVPPARHLRRRRRPQVRLLPQPVPLRRTTSRRFRLRARPAGGDPRRRGEHPRGDRLPEDPVGQRPDDRCPPGGRCPAPGRARVCVSSATDEPVHVA